MINKNKTKRIAKGFTLVEAILATVILCGAVLAIGAVSTRSMSTVQNNRFYEEALSIADRQLTMVDYMGVEDFISLGKDGGTIQSGEMEYYWQIETADQGIDNLYLVNATVSWLQGGRMFSVGVDTMINGLGLLEEDQAEDQDSGQGNNQGSNNNQGR
jgi:type II secretory pathway pseudopilin PulG